MPRNQAERMLFALLTVLVTVHAYVFYSLFVVNGPVFTQLTGEVHVLDAIRHMGGVSVLGRMVPIWAVVLIEFVLAYTLEVLVGSPCSFRLACRVFDPAKTHPVLFETAIICATVGIMSGNERSGSDPVLPLCADGAEPPDTGGQLAAACML